MRKCRLVAAALVLALFAAASVPLRWLTSAGTAPPRPSFGYTFGHIRLGMTAADVETLLGVPAGDYRAVPQVWTSRHEAFRYWLSFNGGVYSQSREWKGDEGIVVVRLDSPDVTVSDERFFTAVRPRTPADAVADWLQSVRSWMVRAFSG
jgi:hypothetical protein